ncbi:MAG: hypothetical protein KJZ64_04030 [Sphingomonadaceae bacterium]|nr:hypothetical protein [Sphingomonadaceae bacterium]
MNRLLTAGLSSLLVLLGGCDSSPFRSSTAGCGSDEARKVVEDLLKEELTYGVQSQLDAQKELGSYDATELENAVKRIKIDLTDVRTSRDDPDSERYACRAALSLELPKLVESKANEVRGMAELGTVRELANRYKMKRKGGDYSTEFDYFIQPTDDGKKLFAEMDDDAPALTFLAEVLASYLLADEIREEKIAQDMEIAREERAVREQEKAAAQMEMEMDAAFRAEGDAALNSAKVQRDLASERINAVWNAMDVGASEDLDKVHSAWVKEMKARCASESAGTDTRASMRQARELQCQTRLVRSCATSLERNIGNSSSQWSYCRF